MIRNYLKIALRNIARYKGYSFITIAGLAIGLAGCIIIFLYISEERSYDKYHSDHERIYRVAQDVQTKTGSRKFASISPPAAAVLKKNFPQVEHAGRFYRLGTGFVRHEATQKAFFEENRFLTDPDILNIFSMPFVKGNPATALVRPNTVVITERMAAKYFGARDPLGLKLKINTGEYEITGVVANPPVNTHWKYDFLLSMSTVETEALPAWKWYETSAHTYVKLHPGIDVDGFAKQIRHIGDPFVGERLKARGKAYVFFLQPLADLHLYSHLHAEIEAPGNPRMITILFAVGLLVLLVACMNFMNLTTARAAGRVREVGLRKVVGGKRLQLMTQFVGEALLISFFAMLSAIWLASLAAPHVNRLLGAHFDASAIYQLPVLAVLSGLTIFTGAAAGFYPAVVLSGYKPIATLKPSFTPGSTTSVLRKTLVLLQFSISIILIIGTTVVLSQLDFMKHRHPGFDRERKLVIPVRGNISLADNYDTIKSKYLEHPGIAAATASSHVPGGGLSSYGILLTGKEKGKNHSMFHLYMDPDFIPDYKIDMLAGRAFDREMSTDEGKTFLINRAAVKALGFNSPEQAPGSVLETGNGGRKGRIIGVTENFHFNGMQHEVEPLVMEWLPKMFSTITLTMNTENPAKVLGFAETAWGELFPGRPFEYHFLDESLDRQYQAEERTANIFSIFAVFGQLIACLGLLGLAAFSTRRRRKEIGIRKVLGASVFGIAFQVSKEFTRWVLAANIIAWPAAYVAMNVWLRNFAFRIDIGIGTFILSGVTALMIALLTVSYHAVKAAASNPIESLRYE